MSTDANGGSELACAVECTDDKNCPLDYTCQDPGRGTTVCVPRAGTCMGDGELLLAVPLGRRLRGGRGAATASTADYSTEHFCTVPKSGMPYSSTTGFTDTCPALPANTAAPPDHRHVGCSYTARRIPLKQCYGLGVFGIGCHTYHAQDRAVVRTPSDLLQRQVRHARTQSCQ